MSWVWVNDAYLLPYYGHVLFYGIIIYISMILWHEMGHGFVFKMLGKNIRYYPYYHSIFKFGMDAGKPKDYEGIDDTEYQYAGIVGIMAGLIPLVTAIYLDKTGFPFWVIGVPYFISVWSDIQEVILKPAKSNDNNEIS